MKYNTNFVNRKTVFIEEDIFKRKPNQNDLIEASMKKICDDFAKNGSY